MRYVLQNMPPQVEPELMNLGWVTDSESELKRCGIERWDGTREKPHRSMDQSRAYAASRPEAGIWDPRVRQALAEV